MAVSLFCCPLLSYCSLSMLSFMLELLVHSNRRRGECSKVRQGSRIRRREIHKKVRLVFQRQSLLRTRDEQSQTLKVICFIIGALLLFRKTFVQVRSYFI